MSGTTRVRGGQVRPTAGRVPVRVGSLIAVWIVLAAAVVVGVAAFLQGA